MVETTAEADSMKVLVCGGRNYGDSAAVYSALMAIYEREPYDTLIIIQGGCPTGADAIARHWCIAHYVPYINVPADWAKHGKSAGPIRNQRMIDVYEPDMVLAFPGGKGTADMVLRAEKSAIRVELAGESD